jgi:hypothetical protein
MPKPNRSAEAVIQRNALVIRVPLKNLQTAIDGAWALNALPARYKITNLDEFARDLVGELNSEDEQGTTRIHKMLDAAVLEAIDQGAFGIDLHEKQDI